MYRYTTVAFLSFLFDDARCTAGWRDAVGAVYRFNLVDPTA